MPNKCDHDVAIGASYGNIPLSELREYIEGCINVRTYFNQGAKPVAFSDYFDLRRNLISRYNFCPYCGEKLDWKRIKLELLEAAQK